MKTASAAAAPLCTHCLVPAGRNAYRGRVAGQEFPFCCFGCYLAFRIRGERGEEAEATLFLIRIGAGAFLAMFIMFLSLLLYLHRFGPDQESVRRGVELILGALATPAVAILGLPILRDAWSAARQGRITTEAMIALSGTAAYLYSVISLLAGGHQIYFDTATMLFLLYTVGRYLDAAARAHAARDLSPLLEAEKASARVITAGGEVTRPAAAVARGELVRVGPGERFPVDGEVVAGRSAVDQSLVTGESLPVDKGPGEAVLAGTVNGDGQLVVRTVASGSATHWSEIGNAVREALARRSQLQRLTDRIAAWFLPFVIVLALASALYWSHRRTSWEALSAALATLVVACPCALGPAAYLASYLGIGLAARRGMVVRSTGALDALARVRCVAFDKTGSLTRGKPALVEIEAIHEIEAIEAIAALAALAGPDEGGAAARLLLGAASRLAARDDHPLAGALLRACHERGIAVTPLAVVETRRGRGLVGNDGEASLALGSAELFGELGWEVAPPLGERAARLEAAGYSVALIGWSGAARGVAGFADELRPEAARAISRLERLGCATAILSGDRPLVVERVARSLGVDRWQAALSPQGKLLALEGLKGAYGRVAMVGDGLNDGPVLAGATVGIALGTGSELARTSAEIVTAGADLEAVPWLIGLARTCVRTTRVNLAWAFGYNAVGLALAAAGLLQPVIAAVLMAASSVLVVVNSLRLAHGRQAQSGLSEAADPVVVGASLAAERRGLGVVGATRT
jgi:Cu2+-exporting ATPase